MKLPRLRTILLAPLLLFAVFYIVLAIRNVVIVDSVAVLSGPAASYDTVAILGASGTAGSGILQAVLADPDIRKVHVISRRTTPLIESGVESGKIELTMHQDYLDYSAIGQILAEVTAVYWAIGTSSVGVDQKTYGMIHVDFPARFVAQWTRVNSSPGLSFHYISSSDISADSSMMWAREKVRAENTLFAFAEDSNLRIIAYRPDYIGPIKEEAHLGQTFLYWFFAPVNAAVKASQIGAAMIEVTARGSRFRNGDILDTGDIIRYSDAYSRRVSAAN